MHRFAGILTVLTMAIVLTVSTGLAQEPAHNMANGGPYKVLKTARVGGEGNWDYIYADAAGRRLYIPRRGGAPEVAPEIPTRLSIFNLDTLEPMGEIDGV